MDLFNYFIVIFTALFFTIDSLGVMPIFISLTINTPNSYRKKMAKKAAVIAFIILFIFAITGSFIMDAFGVSVSSFRIAGGILLLLLAIDMVLSTPESPKPKNDSDSSFQRKDISVFPLAIPLLSGPAGITLLILFMKQANGILLKQLLIILALLLNMIICWLILMFANKISRILGESGVNVLTKIFGILLTALACQLFIDGVREAFHLT